VKAAADHCVAIAEDASVSECTWTLSALEALRNALYKFNAYLLTYFLMRDAMHRAAYAGMQCLRG